MSAGEQVVGIDHLSTERWLTAHVDRLAPPLRFSLISGGHSNLTYVVDDAAGTSVVLRRPPLGARHGGAHDVAREHAVLSALQGTPVPVPEPLALCEDDAVNGAPFYVMSRVPGRVVDNPPAADAVLAAPGSRRRASEQIVDVLAQIHLVDVDAVGLGGAARREGFLERQLGRMHGMWETTRTRDLPLVDELHRRLVQLQPEQRSTGIVHGDYRLGNVLVDPSGTITGVLDWELWTLGDVLADVGFLLNNWYEPGDTAPQVWMEAPPTLAGGFASRVEVVERYAAATGHDVSAIEYYSAFQHWKVAILAEGVKRRYESATMGTADVDFQHLAQRVVDLAQLAAEHLSQVEGPDALT